MQLLQLHWDWKIMKLQRKMNEELFHAQGMALFEMVCKPD
jgi:hypothetical protein